VSYFLESTWQVLRKSDNVNEDYQLVIICSDPQHYVASLFHEVSRIHVDCRTCDAVLAMSSKITFNRCLISEFKANGTYFGIKVSFCSSK